MFEIHRHCYDAHHFAPRTPINVSFPFVPGQGKASSIIYNTFHYIYIVYNHSKGFGCMRVCILIGKDEGICKKRIAGMIKIRNWENY
jgi:hypothetical protein